jgi:hypothetical protein
MTGIRRRRASNKQIDNTDHDQIIKLLSMEYQTLREEILVRTSGRFQFLGLMTTAAALLTTGVVSPSIFKDDQLIAAALAAVVFIFGVACFVYLGRRRIAVSIKVAAIEKRINAMVPAEPGFPDVLNWETYYGQLTLCQRIRLALFPNR